MVGNRGREYEIIFANSSELKSFSTPFDPNKYEKFKFFNVVNIPGITPP